MDKQGLITYYTNKLNKVKQFHNPDKAVSSFDKEKCQEYISFAEQQLNEVKNGRNW